MSSPPIKPPKPTTLKADTYIKSLDRASKAQTATLRKTQSITSGVSLPSVSPETALENVQNALLAVGNMASHASKRITTASSLHQSDDATNNISGAEVDQPPPKPPKPGYLKAGDQYNFLVDVTATKNSGNANHSVMRFSGYAHNVALFAGFLGCYLGIVSIFWFRRVATDDVLPEGTSDLLVTQKFTGFYTLAVGLFTLLFEYRYGLNRTFPFDKKFYQYRAIIYFMLAGATFTGYATILVGACLLLAAAINFIAVRYKEVGQMKRGTYWPKYFGWEEDKGTFYVSIVYIALNFMVFYYNFLKVEFGRERCVRNFGGTIRNEQVQANCPTVFAPIAKGFGNVLNLNCALIILPILRAILTRLAERINKDNSFPIRKAIEFHQVIGTIVFLAVVGHMFMHYINFTLAPGFTILAFGNAAWFTGIALTFVMVIMYSGAHYIVKRQNYELFWFSHHFYSLFFMLLLAHAPHFWQWFFLPCILFAFEKVMRNRSRLKRKVYVRSVEFIPPVLNINFAPERVQDFMFKEGQYLYILCPQASGFQWHPFSMSSAFGDLEKFNYVSVHIRIQDDPKSWTYKLNEYFRLIAGKVNTPPNSPFFADGFFHFDQAGKKQRGLHNGPDGRPLILVDGPFNSPTQVYASYRHVMLVGSGIGLTPSAGILRSVLRYKWGKGFFPETLRFCWILRQSEAESFFWFIELLVDLMARVKSDRQNGAIPPNNFLQINIYVTGAGKASRLTPSVSNPTRLKSAGPGEASARARISARQSARKSVRDRRRSVARRRLDSVDNPFVYNETTPNSPKSPSALSAIPVMNMNPERRRIEDDTDVQEAGIAENILGFDAADLYEAIVRPSISSDEQIRIDPDQATGHNHVRERENNLEDIWIWNGRPMWSTIFSQTKQSALKRNTEAALSNPYDDVETGTKNKRKQMDGHKGDVGVCFCGSSIIGHDLQVNAKKFTDKGLEFKLNQEYF